MESFFFIVCFFTFRGGLLLLWPDFFLASSSIQSNAPNQSFLYVCMYVWYVWYVCYVCMYVMYVMYVCMLCMYVMYGWMHVGTKQRKVMYHMHACGHQAKESDVSYACMWTPNKGKWCLICMHVGSKQRKVMCHMHACGYRSKVTPTGNRPKNVCATKSRTSWPSQYHALCWFIYIPPSSLFGIGKTTFIGRHIP